MRDPTRRQVGLAALASLAGLTGSAGLPGCAEFDVAENLPLPGHRFVGEFEPMRAVWLSFDQGHEDLTVGLMNALRPHVALKLVLADADAAEHATKRLRERGVDLQGITPVLLPAASFFVRDLALFCVGPGALPQRPLGVVDFRWTNYGTPAWCARRFATEPERAAHCATQIDAPRGGVDRALARHMGAGLQRSLLSIEGGGVEVNGQGLLIANAALWRQRNPGLTQADMEREMLRLPGIQKVLWLPEGLAEDVHLRGTITGNHVAWGTGGHTDEFVRFVDPTTLLLAWPEDADVANHPVARLTRARMQTNFNLLSRATAVDGQPLRVIKLPMPRPIERRVFLSAGAETALSREWTADFFPPAEGRRQGQPVQQVATASYLNFVLANGALVLPDYLPHGTPKALQERVRRIFEQVLPGRQISFVDAITAHWVGGGLHCATLTQP